MKTKVIAIDEDLGVFLGSTSGYAVFSKSDWIGLAKAYGFETIDSAKQFFQMYMPNKVDQMKYCVIQTPTDYVSCVDIIKHGYGKYTYNMVDYLETPSKMIH